MSRKTRQEVLRAEDRPVAKELGAVAFVNSRRYKGTRHLIFAALDGVVQTLEGLKYPNPYDGFVLGGCAAIIVRNDTKSVGAISVRKNSSLIDEREELFRLIGLLIAEQYLNEHREDVPAESRLSSPDVLLDSLDELFEDMKLAGRAIAQVMLSEKEMDSSIGDPGEGADIARLLVEESIGVYESLIPKIGDEDDIPKDVQRESMAKAAFLKLGVDDLEQQAAEDGLKNLPNKDALAMALAKRHASDLDEVARLVLRRQGGDPDFGLVSRLIPLREPVNLDAAEQAFIALRHRYLEARTAVFFIFGEATRDPGRLRLEGRIRSFTVNPVEGGGETRLSFNPRNEDVSIVLREDENWAEVNARRTSDLNIIRAVLRRSGEVSPSMVVEPPSPVAEEPFSTWDPRTLWVLDFLRRELQSRELKLDNMLMANFLTDRGRFDKDGSEDRPSVSAVRLLGSQLYEHPEACARISARAQLRDIDLRIRKILDFNSGTSHLVRFRLSCEADHIAVLTGVEDEALDPDVHRQIVRIIRRIADRELDEEQLLPTLREIQSRAQDGAVSEDAVSVLHVAP